MIHNYTAFYQRYTLAIRQNLNTTLRIPVIKRACLLLNRFDDYLQDEAINNWVEDFKLSKKLLSSFLLGDVDPQLSPIDELREYLLTFNIKQNEITSEIVIHKNKKYYTLEELELEMHIEKYDIKHYKKFINPANK